MADWDYIQADPILNNSNSWNSSFRKTGYVLKNTPPEIMMTWEKYAINVNM